MAGLAHGVDAGEPADAGGAAADALGEVGAAREALSHSGRSVEQWSEDWRRRRPGATGASFPASTSGPLTAGPVPVARPTPVR